ncbi:unnamed protein product [Hyaloperonospora brassicae]|uniref:Heat shock factor binding protein 1 n=1 Tax=Hyaloperonospora brassicae TaxID=162125 RepID=A0AAV0UVF6_HYABA|nr:unnamed protein product [Hyaloperonospora brassicae]
MDYVVVQSSSDASKNNSASSAPATGPTDAQDLTVFVQSLLEQMNEDLVLGFLDLKRIVFSCYCGCLLDDMGSRIDELEKSIGGLMEQANEDGNDKDPRESTAPTPKEE